MSKEKKKNKKDRNIEVSTVMEQIYPMRRQYPSNGTLIKIRAKRKLVDEIMNRVIKALIESGKLKEEIQKVNNDLSNPCVNNDIIIPTPDGDKAVSTLKEGDRIYGPRGKYLVIANDGHSIHITGVNTTSVDADVSEAKELFDFIKQERRFPKDSSK